MAGGSLGRRVRVACLVWHVGLAGVGLAGAQPDALDDSGSWDGESGSGSGGEDSGSSSWDGELVDDAEACSMFGLVACGFEENGDVICALDCGESEPELSDAEACSLFGLVACGSDSGEMICALECAEPEPGPELSDAEMCAMVGLVACGSDGGEVICSMACEDPQPTDAEACSMFGLVPCESATGETVCALECPGSTWLGSLRLGILLHGRWTGLQPSLATAVALSTLLRELLSVFRLQVLRWQWSKALTCATWGNNDWRPRCRVLH